MVRPQQNLPGESQQWARSVESDIDRLLRAQDDQNGTLSNTLSGLANSVSNLGILVKTLSEQQAQLTAQQAELSSAVTGLAQQQAYLTSLKSRNAAVGGWATSSFAADSVWHWDSATPTVTLDVPTGKVRIIVRASNALASTSVSTPGLLRVGLTYSISGGVVNAGDNISWVSGEIGKDTSAPIVHIGTVTMAPGTYQFTGYRGYFCSTNGANKTASVSNTALIVEVVNPD